MAERFGRQSGGIEGVLQELDAYEDAIRADLLRIGYSLDDVPEKLDWRDLLALLRSSPRDSAYVRAKVGTDIQWGLLEELVATVFDEVRRLSWALTAPKGTPAPKPLDRPSTRRHEQTIGAGESWTPESLDAWILEMEAG